MHALAKADKRNTSLDRQSWCSCDRGSRYQFFNVQISQMIIISFVIIIGIIIITVKVDVGTAKFSYSQKKAYDVQLCTCF